MQTTKKHIRGSLRILIRRMYGAADFNPLR